MPKSKGKRETTSLIDLMVGVASGNPDVAKKITRRGSQNRFALMALTSLSNTATPEQKAVAHEEMKYAFLNQTGRAIKKKTEEYFGVA